MKPKRREFLLATATLGATGLVQAIPAAAAEPAAEKTGKGTGREKTATPQAAEAEVSATEDLMREHGVLRRILVVYEEAMRRMSVGVEVGPRTFAALPPGKVPELLHQSATLVRKFVEDYHEQLEEKYIFPLFTKRDRLVPLVKTLLKQHEAGRALTAAVIASTTAKTFDNKSLDKLTKATGLFVRMYRGHAAREDTVLFPGLHELLSNKEMDTLGDQFENEENRRFGNRGFEKTVEQVATIEKELGILDLDKFTPSAAELEALRT